MPGRIPTAGGPAIVEVRVRTYTVPTGRPEQDGTLDWNATTLVLAEIEGGGVIGQGFVYGDRAAAGIMRDTLAPLIRGRNALDIPGCWQAMATALRNLGRPGVGTTALSVLDVALWDLKSRMLGLSLSRLLGTVRDGVPAYGSGGFTTYTDDDLARQLEGWMDLGLRHAKIKVGRDAARDLERVRLCRGLLGPGRSLMVDANGALDVQRARAQAEAFAGCGVSWFEEPVSSDDLEGLREIALTAPPGMEIAAGEYGWDAIYFRRMLQSGAVHVLQPDAGRCGGVTGFLQAEALAAAFGRPLSAHTAPSLHAHLGCACAHVRHVEYFHDHARIERMLFDGALVPVDGRLVPDHDAPGLGLTLKKADAERYAD
jgi:L-alanine-DL-glutamate epimerase-like enolase superfamily enzyme